MLGPRYMCKDGLHNVICNSKKKKKKGNLKGRLQVSSKLNYNTSIWGFTTQ